MFAMLTNRITRAISLLKNLEWGGAVNDEYSDFSAFLGGKVLVTPLSINLIDQDFPTTLRAVLS